MPSSPLQDTLRTIAEDVQALRQLETPSTSLFLEPFLMQTLMVVADQLPQEVQPLVREIIDTCRILKPVYGTYVRFPEQLPAGMQVVSFHEEAAAASQQLARVQACEIAGRVERLRVRQAPLPAAHPQATPHEEEQWAVLVAADVDRAALLARLYPQQAKHSRSTVITMAYDQQSQTTYES